MATTYYNFNLSGSGILQTFGAGSGLYVSEGVTVGSTNDYAFTAAGGGISMEIHGAVHGDAGGLLLGSGGNTTVMIGEEGSVSANPSFASAIRMDGFDGTIENHGLIRGNEGVEIDNTVSAWLNNHGLMHTENETVLLNASSTGSFFFSNRGMVTTNSDSYAVYDSQGTVADAVINYGVMNGAINLGKGSDGYYGQHARNMTGGQLQLIVEFSSPEQLRGIKTLSSYVQGGDGADTLNGGKFSDFFTGGTGKDVMNGGGGQDLLVGMQGADRMAGGGGRDVFTYITTAESVGKNYDTILDFSTQQRDRIDLDIVDANTIVGGIDDFRFIGTKAFSGKAGELRYAFEKGDTVILGNTDKDKAAEFEIHLDGHINLDAQDFFF